MKKATDETRRGTDLTPGKAVPAKLDLREQITWKKTADEVPDDDLTVLVQYADGEVELGFLDAGKWRCFDACPAVEVPVFWAQLPGGPLA